MTHDVRRRPVLVVIPTYRRIELLTPLLREIDRQAAELALRVRTAVVDNDPDRSAEPVAAEAGVEYVHEPRPGIGFVRRTGLGHARAGELVAMIDDDVMPEPGWLRGLVETWSEFTPTVVMGYVRYVWPPDCDPWIAAGGFMRRTRNPTGMSLPALATGNVLIDVDAMRRIGVDFVTDRGLAGGEDTIFGRAVIAAGGTIVASDVSVARDEVPRERTTREFVRRRAISQGQTLTAVNLRGVTGLRRLTAQVGAVIGALVRLVVFGAQHLMGRITRNVSRDAVGKRRYWFALGRLSGALGHGTAEYARNG